MNKQRSQKLALRKETVRTLRQIDLQEVAGAIMVTQFTCVCPSLRMVCLTTHTTTNP
ncbi:MAG TPA: hypothetical protein VLM79_01420 [Kofleriaceae bacterium]|nr:hypothetical protein [Kofleriaceae bacterium]